MDLRVEYGKGKKGRRRDEIEEGMRVNWIEVV